MLEYGGFVEVEELGEDVEDLDDVVVIESEVGGLEVNIVLMRARMGYDKECLASGPLERV